METSKSTPLSSALWAAITPHASGIASSIPPTSAKNLAFVDARLHHLVVDLHDLLKDPCPNGIFHVAAPCLDEHLAFAVARFHAQRGDGATGYLCRLSADRL
eukprot:2638416-Amphidinium_carterae.1